MKVVTFQDEDVNNLLALLNRVQIQGNEAEVVVRLRQLLVMAPEFSENGAEKEEAKP